MSKTTTTTTTTEVPQCSPHNVKDKESIQFNIDLLMEEYRLGEEIGGKYFSYLYSTMNFTIIMYAAVIAVFQSLFKNYQSSSTYLLIFSYLLPVMTYILGLFYSYNAIAISRQGYFMICIEQDIAKLCAQAGVSRPIHGWNILSKEPPSGCFMLPYGTMLCFYILSPAFFVFFNGLQLEWATMFTTPLEGAIWVIVFPCLFFLIYLIFTIIIVGAMFELRKMYSKKMTLNSAKAKAKPKHQSRNSMISKKNEGVNTSTHSK